MTIIIFAIFACGLFLAILSNKKQKDGLAYNPEYLTQRTAYLRRYVELLEHYRKQEMITEEKYQQELKTISDELDTLEGML